MEGFSAYICFFIYLCVWVGYFCFFVVLRLLLPTDENAQASEQNRELLLWCLFNTFCTAERGPCSSRLCCAAHGTRPLFPKLYFCCLGKHSQTGTGLKTNFLPMKGENSLTCDCIVLMFKSAKIVFWSIGNAVFMDNDSKHNVDDSDDEWVLDSD